jgi:nucleotide-binding universal stress UspA family protein
MTLAVILVLLEGIDSDETVAETALAVGAAYEARVDGLIVRPDPRDTVRLAFDGMSSSMIEGIMAEVRSDSRERIDKARDTFQRTCARHDRTPGENAGWTEETGPATRFVAARGRLSDLIVLGRPGKPGAVEGFVAAEAALFETGRPMLLAGARAPEKAFGTVVVAWNGSAESAAAVAGAMAFLKAAETVAVLAIDESETAAPDRPPSAAALADYLARHHIAAALHRPDSDARSIGEALLAEASGLGADLLVMGAYSHSRLRELVLGGVTRHILAKAELPVLMAR